MSNLPINKMKSKEFKPVFHKVIKIYVNTWSVKYEEKADRKKLYVKIKES